MANLCSAQHLTGYAHIENMGVTLLYIATQRPLGLSVVHGDASATQPRAESVGPESNRAADRGRAALP